MIGVGIVDILTTCVVSCMQSYYTSHFLAFHLLWERFKQLLLLSSMVQKVLHNALFLKSRYCIELAELCPI